jgi:hypothetical protein
MMNVAINTRTLRRSGLHQMYVSSNSGRNMLDDGQPL